MDEKPNYDEIYTHFTDNQIPNFKTVFELPPQIGLQVENRAAEMMKDTLHAHGCFDPIMTTASTIENGVVTVSIRLFGRAAQIIQALRDEANGGEDAAD